jgi:WD40-like Beta Propeller Repeat
MPRPRKLLAGAAALCALAIAAPAANADSIAYVKDGNVWLSTTDGARQFQVTSDGGYSDVSQADDGTMIALHGNRLRKLDRLGNVQADFATPVTDDRPAPAKTFYGPYDPAISPDGTKVAYSYYYMTQSQSPTCFPPTCYTTINEGGTGYTHSDRLTGWDEPGLRKHSGWRFPIWVDNATTILSNPTHLPNDDVVVDVPEGTSVGLLRSWFTDAVQGNPGVGGGDITRDQHKLALQTGENNSTLTVYSLSPGVPTSWRDGADNPEINPIVCYRYSDPIGGQFGIPSFAPDGGRMAFAVGDGIHIAAVPDFGGGCTLDGATVTPPLVIPGGKEPDWGPADVPASRPSQGGGGSTGGQSKLTVAVSATTLKKALRSGLKITVKVPAAGKLSATATRKGKTVGTAAKKPVAAGKRTITLRFGKAARRALARSRSVKLTLKVTFAPKGGTAATAKKAVTLK